MLVKSLKKYLKFQISKDYGLKTKARNKLSCFIVAYLVEYFNLIFTNFFIHKILNIINKTKMNTTEMKGNWNEQKGKLKQRFAELTDNDLLFVEGKKDELLGRLQVKLGKSKEEITAILAEL